jgi:hypothetical protein
MKWILFIAAFTFTNFANAKSFIDSLEGKWVGFCSPLATSGTSKICTYTFKRSSGTYSCEFYKDLRCANKSSETSQIQFKYSVSQSQEKTGKVTLDFQDFKDVTQEKHGFFITGDVLRVQTYEVVRLPSSKSENLEAQGVVPFFEYTRSK